MRSKTKTYAYNRIKNETGGTLIFRHSAQSSSVTIENNKSISCTATKIPFKPDSGFSASFYIVHGHGNDIPWAIYQKSGTKLGFEYSINGLKCVDVPKVVNPEKGKDTHVQLVFKKVDNGVIIGEVDMDPDPEFSIHSVDVDGDFQTVNFYVERGAVIPVVAEESAMIETRPLPIIRSEAEREMPGFFPVNLHIALADQPTVFTSMNMYLQKVLNAKGETELYLWYYPDHFPKEVVRHPYPIDEAALLYGSIRLHFRHNPNFIPPTSLEEASPLPHQEPGAATSEPFILHVFDTWAVPPAENHIPVAGLKIDKTGGQDASKWIFTLGGQVVLPASTEKDPKGAEHVVVIAKDMDPTKKDDHLGRCITNKHGYFEIQWEAPIHMDSERDLHPDIYFQVKHGRETLLSTQSKPLMNCKPQTDLFVLTLPQP